jgi:nicotinate-nucleotide adenylyltransferase
LFPKHDTVSVGILGGTFNPPHLGHLRLAEEVAELYDLTKVIFIPTYIPPHKKADHIISAAHRLHMTRLACSDHPLFEVSDIEVERSGPSYTVDTLDFLKREFKYETFFIIGTDALAEIHLWKDYEKLFGLSHFIIVERPQTPFASAWAAVPSAVRSAFTESGDRWVHTSSRQIIPAPVRGLNISATGIRSLLREGRSIRYLVTDSVRSYISEHDLYGNYST